MANRKRSDGEYHNYPTRQVVRHYVSPKQPPEAKGWHYRVQHTLELSCGHKTFKVCPPGATFTTAECSVCYAVGITGTPMGKPLPVKGPTIQRKLVINNAVLLYQGGIANVFAVENIAPYRERRGEQKRLLQADFRSCEWFARGLECAGVNVASMHCNMAGDAADQVWSWLLDDAPFRSDMYPVGKCVTDA